MVRDIVSVVVLYIDLRQILYFVLYIYIQQSWTEASKDLFIATGNRAYFKEIKILVPRTWTEKSYDTVAGSENYDQVSELEAYTCQL